MRCPSCETENPAHVSICVQCGTRMRGPDQANASPSAVKTGTAPAAGAGFQLQPPKKSVPAMPAFPSATSPAAKSAGTQAESQTGPEAADAWSVFQMRAPRQGAPRPAPPSAPPPAQATSPRPARAPQRQQGRSFLEPPRTHLVPPAQRPQARPSAAPGAPDRAQSAPVSPGHGGTPDKMAVTQKSAAEPTPASPAPKSPAVATPPRPARVAPAPVPIDADSQAAGLLRAQTSIAERPVVREPALQSKPAPDPIAPAVQVVTERSSQPSHIREVLRGAETHAETHAETTDAPPAVSSAADIDVSLSLPVELDADIATFSAVDVSEIDEQAKAASIRLASLFRGLLGGGVDAALVAVCALLATVALRPEAFSWLDASQPVNVVEDPFGWVAPVSTFAMAATVFSTLYHAWFLPSLSATLGQRLVGARVITYARGERPARLRAAFRGAFAALGCLGCGIGPLWAIWIDSHRRSLGDRFAGTVLVRNLSVKENHVG